jgi:hypothetical protein
MISESLLRIRLVEDTYLVVSVGTGSWHGTIFYSSIATHL